jgi:preprotein translocase subunit YajC
MLHRHFKESPLIHLLAQSTSGGGTQTGNPLVGLALPILMLAGLYFVLIRPQRNRARAQQALLATLEVGDEVLTTSGIFGTIVEMDQEEGTLTVEIAPGTRVRMLRQGIAQRFVEEEDYDQDGPSGEGADAEP